MLAVAAVAVVTAATLLDHDPAGDGDCPVVPLAAAVAFHGPRGAWARYRIHLLTERGLARTTVDKYRERLCELEASTAKPWHKLTTRDVGRFLERPHARTGQALALATRRSYVTTFRGFFAYATRQGWVRRDPMGDFTVPRQARTEVARAIRFEDREGANGLRTLLGYCATHPRLEVMVRLACYGGLRVSEIAGLRREHVWLGDDPYMRVLGKGAKWRKVPLDTELAAVLRAWLAPMPGSSGPVLPDPRYPGVAITGKSVSDQIGRVLRALEVRTVDGYQARPHDLRHTALTELLEACGDPLAVQEFAGHASFSTTEGYVRAAKRQVREAVDAAAAARRARQGSAA